MLLQGCKGTGAALECGVTGEEPHSLTATRYTWRCQDRLAPTSHGLGDARSSRRGPRARRGLPCPGDPPGKTPGLRHYSPVRVSGLRGHTPQLSPPEFQGVGWGGGERGWGGGRLSNRGPSITRKIFPIGPRKKRRNLAKELRVSGSGGPGKGQTTLAGKLTGISST